MDERLPEEDRMTTRRQTRLVHKGECVGEVDVELLDSDEAWAPNSSIEQAQKLDAVREALRRGDIAAATKLARVFRLTPVSQ